MRLRRNFSSQNVANRKNKAKAGLPIKVRQATKAGVSKRSKKSGSVRHTKNAKPSFYALFRAFFPFFAATGNTHVRVRPEKTVSSEKTVKRSRPRSEDFAALHPVRKSAHGNKHITPEDLANLKELFRAKVSERKKVATLPSSLLLGKKETREKRLRRRTSRCPLTGISTNRLRNFWPKPIRRSSRPF